jgi:DNA-binding CsgD family transcriptional regulator
MDARQVERLNARFGDAALDPSLWPEIMEQLCTAVGARGAVLLQSDLRTPDVPRTSGLDHYLRSYFTEGWHERDIRAERGVPLLLNGEKVIIDQDILTPEEIERAGLYAESLIPNGLRWFAAIGFWAGPALWGLSIQRTSQEGPFEREEKPLLARLSQRLTEAATLSQAVGRVALSNAVNALNLVTQPALALDRFGLVLAINAAADALFDDQLRVVNRRLLVCDQRAKAALAALIDRLRTVPDTAALPVAPIVVRRPPKRPIIIRVLPIDGAARSPFLGARVLLVFSDLGRPLNTTTDVLAETFGLSPAEARLASRMAGGISLEEAAGELAITRETARNQLKSIFAKTGTHRQGELVALLAKL